MPLFAAQSARLSARFDPLYSIRLPTGVGPFILAVAVGILAGFGSVALQEMVEGFDALFFDRLGGELTSLAGDWAILFVPVLIVVPVIWLITRFVPETRGHGVPEVMRAVETQGGRIPLRIPVTKAIASALTIGGGGSVGREGPIVQVAAGLASFLGRITRQPQDTVVLMVAGGAAGGIAATFNAPIAGVFFALEVILRRFNVRNFTLVVVSAVVANMIAIAIEGDRPGIVIPDYALESAIEIGLYALLGLAAAFVGVFWLRLLYLVEDIFEVLPTSSYTKPIVAMFALGALGFWHDEVFGTGFAAIEQATLGEIATGTLAILLVIKPLATSLTLGGGASGGVFAPSLFIGAMLGGLFGAAFVELAPDQVGPSGAYAVVGMAAVFAAAARAPITSLFIVFELTRDYSLILPLMTAVAIATAVAQIITRDTIYSIKLARRGVDVTEEPAAAVVADLTVAETMSTNVPLVTEDTDLQELTLAMSRSRGTVLAVTDEEGRFRGLVSATDLTAALERTDQNLVASDISVASPQRVYPDDQLGHVVELMAEGDLRQLPVVARWDERRLLGMISQRDVLRQVARRGPRLAGTTRRAAPVRRLIGAVQIEFTVKQESGLVGRELREIQLPEGSIVTIIHRQGTVVIPRGQVTVEAGDQLTILAEPVAEAAVRRVLADVVQAADAGTGTAIESSPPSAPDSD